MLQIDLLMQTLIGVILCAFASVALVYYWKFAAMFSRPRAWLEETVYFWPLVCGECLGTGVCTGLWLFGVSKQIPHLGMQLIGWLAAVGVYYLCWNCIQATRSPMR